MTLYESLVGNIGIGKEALNKKYLKSVFNKYNTQQWFTNFCNRYDLVPTIAELRSMYRGVDSQKVSANWYDFSKGEEVAYMLEFVAYGGHCQPVVIDGTENFIAIIANRKELKKYYDKLDKLFTTFKFVGQAEITLRYYYWRDCKYSIEDLMRDNKLMKELNESLIKNVGIGQKQIYEYNKKLMFDLFKKDDYELFNKILKNLKLDILDKKLVTKIADELNEKSDYRLNYYSDAVYNKDINQNMYYVQIGANMWKGSRHIYQQILLIDWDKIAVIDDLPELKDTYKFLDKNFGTYKEYTWDWLATSYVNNKSHDTYQARVYKLENSKIFLDQ